MRNTSLSAAIIAILFIGAGCASTDVALPAANVNVSVAPATPEPIPPVVSGVSLVLEGEVHREYWRDYDRESDGLIDWTMTSIVANATSKEKSCNPLRASKGPFRDPRQLLPVQFAEPSLCMVKESEAKSVVYAIGLGQTYEGYPYLNATVIVLADDGMAIVSVEPSGLRKMNDDIRAKYDFRGIEFPGEKFGAMYEKIQADFLARLATPSVELKDIFADLQAAKLEIVK